MFVAFSENMNFNFTYWDQSKRGDGVFEPLGVLFHAGVQLNLHETDLLLRYLSHYLTLHCLLIYVFSLFLPVLAC